MTFLNKKRIIFFLVILFVGFVLPTNAFAECGVVCRAVTEVMGWFFATIIMVIGWILTLLINVLITILSYNEFVASDDIKLGWVVVRDIANMFFAIIILIIAFATILQQETYSIQKTLPTLIIMAILVNFSKTIAGVFIDLSQVVTLTFVNSFRNSSVLGFSNMLAIQDIIQLNPNSSGDVTMVNVLGAYLLALVYMVIAVIVIAVLVVVAVQRTIMLWILVVLSPLPYVLSIIPAGQKYAEKWWSEFGKYCVNIPVLSFFLWLSLSMFSTGTQTQINAQKDTNVFTGEYELKGVQAGVSKAGTSEVVLSFLIGVGMLVGSLMVAQELGGMAGKAVGKGYGAMAVSGKFAGKMTGKALGKIPEKIADRMGNAAKKEGGLGKAAALGAAGFMALAHPKKTWDNVKKGWEDRKAAKNKAIDDKMAGVTRTALDKGGRTGAFAAIAGGDIKDNIGKVFTGASTPQELDEAITNYEKEKEFQRINDLPTTTQQNITDQLIATQAFNTKYASKNNPTEDVFSTMVNKKKSTEEQEKEGEYNLIRDSSDEKDKTDKIKDFNKKHKTKLTNEDFRADITANIAIADYNMRKEQKRAINTTTSDAIRKKSISEKQDEHKNVTEGDEFARIAKEEIEDKNIINISAVFREAAKKGKMGSILHSQGYDSSTKGLQGIMDKLTTIGVLTKTEADKLGYEISNLASDNGEAGLAGFGSLKNGRYTQNSPDEINKIQINIGKKGDAQNFLQKRKLSDHGGKDKKGVFQFTEAFIHRLSTDESVSEFFVKHFDKVPQELTDVLRKNLQVIDQAASNARTPTIVDSLRAMKEKL